MNYTDTLVERRENLMADINRLQNQRTNLENTMTNPVAFQACVELLDQSIDSLLERIEKVDEGIKRLEKKQWRTDYNGVFNHRLEPWLVLTPLLEPSNVVITWEGFFMFFGSVVDSEPLYNYDD